MVQVEWLLADYGRSFIYARALSVYRSLFWPMALTLAAMAAAGKDYGLFMRVRLGFSDTNDDGGYRLSRVLVDRAWSVFRG